MSMTPPPPPSADEGIKGTRTVITDLFPGRTYIAQVAGVREITNTLVWSPSLEFITDRDDVAPSAPSNLTVTIQSGGLFRASWDAPTTNEDGSLQSETNDLDGYFVVFYPTNSPDLAREYYVTETQFDVDMGMNELFFGGVGSLTFEVRSRDLASNQSAPVSAIATVEVPQQPTNFLAENGPISVYLSWDNVPSVSYYEVYRDSVLIGTVSSLPTAGTVAEPTRAAFYHIPPDSQSHSYWVVAYNAFGDASDASVSDTAEAKSPISNEDITYTPGAPVIAPAGPHRFSITHSLTEYTEDLGFLEVSAGPTTGAERVLGTVAIGFDEAGNPTLSDEFTYVVEDNQTSIVATVVPVNSAGRKFESLRSAPSNRITIERSGGVHIDDQSITNAHIVNVWAEKIEAGTSFVNDLNVKSIFTVAAGGLVKSANYDPDAAGWAINSTGYAELNDVKIRGTVQATAGFLDGLTVRNTITVGEVGTPGSISALNGDWSINSDGTANFANASVVGYIGATSGYLKNLNVDGPITVSNLATSYIGTPNYDPATNQGWRIFGDGLAVFNNAQIRGQIEFLDGRDAATAVDGAIDAAGTAQTTAENANTTAIASRNPANWVTGVIPSAIQIKGNYQAGVSGWAIDGMGNAEFNGGTFRGTVIFGDGRNAATAVDSATNTATNAQSDAWSAQNTASSASSAASSANSTLNNWAWDTNRTYINGGDIYTGTISAAKISGGTITGSYVYVGTTLSLASSGRFVTATSGQRVEITQSSRDRILFYNQYGNSGGSIGAAYTDSQVQIYGGVDVRGGNIFGEKSMTLNGVFYPLAGISTSSSITAHNITANGVFYEQGNRLARSNHGHSYASTSHNHTVLQGSSLINVYAGSAWQFGGYYFGPHYDNQHDLGRSGQRPRRVFAASGVVSTSDGKTKSSVRESPYGLEFVNRLRAADYIPATHRRRHVGFIAQDVKQVLDDMEIDTEDFGGYIDPNVRGDGGPLGLNYQEFIPILWRAVQELSAEVETLREMVKL